jgi:hypothetical protein
LYVINYSLQPELKHSATSGLSTKRAEQGSMEKIKKMMEVIKALMDKKFTGYIKINFTRGSVERIEKFEEILKK